MSKKENEWINYYWLVMMVLILFNKFQAKLGVTSKSVMNECNGMEM